MNDKLLIPKKEAHGRAKAKNSVTYLVNEGLKLINEEIIKSCECGEFGTSIFLNKIKGDDNIIDAIIHELGLNEYDVERLHYNELNEEYLQIRWD